MGVTVIWDMFLFLRDLQYMLDTCWRVVRSRFDAQYFMLHVRVCERLFRTCYRLAQIFLKTCRICFTRGLDAYLTHDWDILEAYHTRCLSQNYICLLYVLLSLVPLQIEVVYQIVSHLEKHEYLQDIFTDFFMHGEMYCKYWGI